LRVLGCQELPRLCGLIVSGDRPLLDLGAHQGLPILPPAPFLERVVVEPSAYCA